MEKLLLSEIVKACQSKTIIQNDTQICDISTDTRKIEKGSLFIPIKGENFDGHNFIEKAFELGASACISQIEVNSEMPVIMVEDTKIAYGKIAEYYRDKLAPTVIGVTGSVGKTSTKEMIAQILSKKAKTHKTYGNFNNEIGLPKTLLETSAEDKFAVIEMGMSDLGEISYLSKIAKPQIGVITNIGVSHLENLKTRENILKAKLEILDGMDIASKIILNVDNDMLSTAIVALANRAITVGINNSADFTAKNIVEQNNKTKFSICYASECVDVILPLVGEHNIYNALIGFAIGKELGVETKDIVSAISEYQNAYMRQNTFEHEGIIIIEDCYNASPDSMNSAIDIISKVDCDGKRFAVLGMMLELGENSKQMHSQVGEVVANSKIDTLLTYKNEAEYIAKTATELGFGEAKHFECSVELAQYIKANVKKGDAIIFKASRSIKLEDVIKDAFGIEK